MSLSLREQAVSTANVLRNIANTMDGDLPSHVTLLFDHADYLMRAVSVEPEALPAPVANSQPFTCNGLLNSLASVDALMRNFRSELSASIFGLPCICDSPQMHSEICIGIRHLFAALDHTTVIANRMRARKDAPVLPAAVANPQPFDDKKRMDWLAVRYISCDPHVRPSIRGMCVINPTGASSTLRDAIDERILEEWETQVSPDGETPQAITYHSEDL